MSEFSHLKNKLLAEQVEDEIYHYILDTPLEPGTKLPNEFELGEKFGVGRSTVREAVKLLSSKGIVEVRRGSGTYVVTTATVSYTHLIHKTKADRTHQRLCPQNSERSHFAGRAFGGFCRCV